MCLSPTGRFQLGAADHQSPICIVLGARPLDSRLRSEQRHTREDVVLLVDWRSVRRGMSERRRQWIDTARLEPICIFLELQNHNGKMHFLIGVRKRI